MRITPFLCVVCCVVPVTGNAEDERCIEIEEFVLAPAQPEHGSCFEVGVRVKVSGVPTVGYVLRTSGPVDHEKGPTSFDYYDAGRRLAYMQEDGQVHLRDNGAHDLDPRSHAFRVRVDTRDWPLGRHDLVLFAHNRPGDGSHIEDHRLFAVWVEEGGVGVADKSRLGEARFTRCDVVPSIVAPGGQVTLHLAWAGPGAGGVEVRQPYYVGPERSPTPFTHDATHVSYLTDDGDRLIRDNGAMDLSDELGVMELPLDTTGWPPGLYYLQVSLPTTVGQPDLRHAVVAVRAPEDHLDVRVSASWSMMAGTHADRMTRVEDGTLLHTTHYSTDAGQTWQARETGTIGSGSVQLRDGRVLGMAYRTVPIDGREGWYRGERYESTDGGRTVVGPLETQFHVPQAKAAHGHAPHPGPLYMRSIVERPDGSLVALMAGWFKGDDTPCPYNPRRPYSRTYTCESDDGGRTWRYLSTIGYDHIGSEGYNEGAMETLPDGRLIAVMRTGNMRDANCQDNPIMVSVSNDGGATWSAPRRTGAHGAFPDLAVLSDGNLALSYGRPGANIVFSRDHGTTWSDHTSVDPTPYSGYTSICEVGPGEILMAFGTKGRIDPQTGERSDGIRLARIRYRKQGDVSPLATLGNAGVSVVSLGEGFYDCAMYSQALGREECFALHLPENYASEKERFFPLIVFLHGAGRHHLSLVEIPQTREVIVRSPAVFLSPNGLNSWWVDSPIDPQSQYASFLEECIAFVTDHLHVSCDAQHRAIGGWSMGGFGSANFAGDHPHAFGAWAGIVALLDFPNAQYDAAHNHTVPAVFGDETQRTIFNPLGKAAALRGTRIMLITADSAFDRLMNEAFAATLTELGIQHSFVTLEGGHTLDVVLKAFPQVMGFFHDIIAE